MIKFHCSCGQKIGVPDERAGRLVRCPTCKMAIEVPKATTPIVPHEQVALHATSVAPPHEPDPVETLANVTTGRGRPTPSRPSPFNRKVVVLVCAAVIVAVSIIIGVIHSLHQGSTPPLPAQIAAGPQPKHVEQREQSTPTPPRPETKILPAAPVPPSPEPVTPAPVTLPASDMSYVLADMLPPQSSNALRMAQDFYAHDLLARAKEILIQITYDSSASDDTKSEALYLLGQIAFDERHFKTAMDDWTKLQTTYPRSARSKEVADRMTQLREVVAKFSDAKLSSIVAQSYVNNGDFWSDGEKTFMIDNSWLPSVEMAIEWYDKVLTEFPKTDGAELAYARKLFALIGWKTPGQYGERYGLKGNFDKYMPQVLQTFEAFEKDFPASSYLQAFRFQIAQAYWVKEDSANATVWLNKIITAGGRGDSFYTKLANARLQKLKHGE